MIREGDTHHPQVIKVFGQAISFGTSLKIRLGPASVEVDATPEELEKVSHPNAHTQHLSGKKKGGVCTP